MSCCCSRRCLLCEPPPFSLRGRGRRGAWPGPSPVGLVGPPELGAPCPGSGPPGRAAPAPLRSPVGAAAAGGSPPQRQVVFLRRLECDTKIFLSRRVCVCVSQQNKGGGMASRRLGRFVIVQELQKGR